MLNDIKNLEKDNDVYFQSLWIPAEVCGSNEFSDKNSRMSDECCVFSFLVVFLFFFRKMSRFLLRLLFSRQGLLLVECRMCHCKLTSGEGKGESCVRPCLTEKLEDFMVYPCFCLIANSAEPSAKALLGSRPVYLQFTRTYTQMFLPVYA